MTQPTTLIKSLKIFAICIALVGCAASYNNQPNDLVSNTPESWTQKASSEASKENWLTELNNESLNGLVTEALASNIELAFQAARLEEAQSSVKVAGADRWPSLTANLSDRQQRNPDIDSASLSLDANWELDIWGKLNTTQRRAIESLQASKLEYENARLQLAANVSQTWFQLINDQSRYNLLEQRLKTLEDDLDIIESSYLQGIASALDVYLAKTSLLQEQANVAAQQQTVIETAARLQRLLGRYPDGSWLVNERLPIIETNIPVGLPSELIARRPDIQQSWHQLLASNANLAIAHKNRFPRLSLTGSITDTSPDLSDVLDADNLIKSLLVNISAPLFQGGRLKGNEDVAAAQLKQAEQLYMATVQDAFSEVETAISRQAQLAKRYQAIEGAQKSAQAGYELSFEQYRAGLVDYATVLQAQRRAFDTETSLIELRNQLLQNRIRLYQALGGNFELDS